MQQSPRKFWEVWGRSDALYNRWAAAHGVNNYRLFVLYVLDNHPGATQKAIADHAGLPKQTVPPSPMGKAAIREQRYPRHKAFPLEGKVPRRGGW